MPRWSRNPRWLRMLAVLVLVVAGCAWLGWWQWGRATSSTATQRPGGKLPIDQVHELGEPVPTEDAGRRVVLHGAYDARREVLVVDRLDDDEPGAWVLTAFILSHADGATIPVVRGWLPQGQQPPPPPEGEVRLEGWLEPSEPTTLRDPGRAPLPGDEVEIVSSAELLSLWRPPLLQGFVIVAQPAPASPLRAVAPPSLDPATEVDWQNLAYAVQWWLFGLFAIFWFVRMVREDQEQGASDIAPHEPDDPEVAPSEFRTREVGHGRKPVDGT